MIKENGMIQIMNEYTRTTQNTKTLIDLIITNTNSIKCKIDHNNNISDHATIQIIWQNTEYGNEMIEKKTILHKYTINKSYKMS